MQLPVTAARAGAVVAAFVLVVVVAVVAGFVTGLPLLQVGAPHAIAAGRQTAGQQAAVLVDVVAVVAFLIADALTDRAVADLVRWTQRVLLGALRPGAQLEVEPGHAVAAERLRAVVAAGVKVVAVAVVALLVAGKPAWMSRG